MINRDLINCLAEIELLQAEKKHPKYFHSEHEAYAVMLEETEEAIEDFKKLALLMTECWDKVKKDEDTSEIIDKMRTQAYYAIAELVQVYAMFDKEIYSKEVRRGINESILHDKRKDVGVIQEATK